MAFTIKIYERDEYIYALLKKRLSNFYPDAYFINPYHDEEDSISQFSDYTEVIYNPSDVNKEDISPITASPIRLTEDGGIIDCARLVALLNTHEDAPIVKRPVTGTLSAVIPFVYSDVRDRYISDLECELSNADFNIRLDFTSRLRALWRGSGGTNMTDLLEACRSRRFSPEDILKYCNIDDSGFLTPGCCKNNDDVYDMGINRSITLMNHAADLAHSDRRLVNVLAVVEGFRTQDLPELLASCDQVRILLPARNAGEDLGARELIESLTRTLGAERITVAYAEEFKTSDEAEYHSIQRRLVV